MFKSYCPRFSLQHTNKSQIKHGQTRVSSTSSFLKYISYFIVLVSLSKNPKVTVSRLQTIKEQGKLNLLLVNAAMS